MSKLKSLRLRSLSKKIRRRSLPLLKSLLELKKDLKEVAEAIVVEVAAEEEAEAVLLRRTRTALSLRLARNPEEVAEEETTKEVVERDVEVTNVPNVAEEERDVEAVEKDAEETSLDLLPLSPSKVRLRLKMSNGTSWKTSSEKLNLLP